MPRITSTRSASAAQIKQDKVTANHINDIHKLNKAAKLGTVSARFFRTSKTGFYPKSKELTPEEALLEMMAGHTVEATAVTWRNYTRRGKRGTTYTQKVRTKVRKAKVQKFKNVKAFEKWWTQVSGDVEKAKKPSNTTRTRTRSGKGW